MAAASVACQLVPVDPGVCNGSGRILLWVHSSMPAEPISTLNPFEGSVRILCVCTAVVLRRCNLANQRTCNKK